MNPKEYFDSPAFEEKYHCDAPLGAFCGAGGTRFFLWAPTAESVVLNLYRDGSGQTLQKQISLCAQERGLWSCSLKENLDGVYYDYEVTVDGICRRTADPYARACGLNGERSMVIDLGRTDPPGWAEDRAAECPSETVIYEVNIKDFSWDPASGVAPEYRGKFKALCQRDTTLNSDGTHPTCLAYLKKLGVTHIQLMPAFDFGSVDEAGSQEQFNWGYDPVNYNVPEGSYSTDPAHGEVRIREMKEAIQALHQNGFRVIMDVVYNHTYRQDSWLWRTVPGYYYRQNEDGTFSNGSACGNDLASERSMCAQYILDSVVYWAEEYHIDGFRFDLMGLLDVDLMNRIRLALDRRWGKGEKLMFGEPWAAGASAVRPGTLLADKANLKKLDRHIGAFCDTIRDAVKGNLEGPAAVGFVNGGRLDGDLLAYCITGCTGDRREFSVQAPSQTINYLSAHDDWTLWDRLVYTLADDGAFDRMEPALLRANRLAAAMCFSCQGHLFLLSGEEFGRTKYGIRNSYNSSPEINRLDWNRAWENQALVTYYQGLIALRKQLPGLTDKSPGAGQRIRRCAAPTASTAVVEVDNTGGNSAWKRLILAFHCGKEEIPLSLPEGKWEVLVDGDSSFCWRAPETVENMAVLAPVSALILGRR